MRHVLRILGSRYGAAAALIVVIALIVGIGKVVGGGSHLPTSGAGSLGVPVASATTSQQPDDGVAGSPTPPAPSTSPGAPDPQTVANSFTRAWLHHTGVTAQQWFDGIAPYSTDTLKSELTGADPATVQASSVSGDPSIVDRSESYVEIVIPLDAGTLTLGLAADDGRWLVDSVDWERP
ncbi:hypothetical protein GCM10023322_67160 [Rugosimonospora acidiphila]|uniref:DUF4878 domain-containing protein n=1 Tax=Rugosimonospora acidiphila TaxID=556531 RepID=A0ABP9SIH1_9ACTN